MRRSTEERAVLAAILLAGFALRVHQLGAQSFWLDEAYTWGIVVQTDWQTVWGAMLAVSDVSPLAYVLAKLVAPMLGVSEFALRLTSVWAGWLAVAVVYRLAGHGALGLMAAGVVAFSPFAVWYARDARPYGLYLLLGALCLWALIRVEEKGSRRDWLLLVVSGAAFYLTHYLAALYAYAQAVYLLTQLRAQPKLFRRWALAQGVAILPVLGWLGMFLAQRQPLTANSWIPMVTVLTPLQTLWNFVSGDAARPDALTLTGAAIVAAAMAVGGGSLKRRWQLLAWWMLLPILTGWLFSFRLPSYVDRFFEPSLLPLALLVGAGILRLPAPWNKAVAGIVLCALLLTSARLFADPRFAKEDWRAAANTIERLQLPVALPDAETHLGLSPYTAGGTAFVFGRDESDLDKQWRAGSFVLAVSSARDSAHALSKWERFDPVAEGQPTFLRQWLNDNPLARARVEQFAGLALVVVSK